MSKVTEQRNALQKKIERLENSLVTLTLTLTLTRSVRAHRVQCVASP